MEKSAGGAAVLFVLFLLLCLLDGNGRKVKARLLPVLEQFGIAPGVLEIVSEIDETVNVMAWRCTSDATVPSSYAAARCPYQGGTYFINWGRALDSPLSVFHGVAANAPAPTTPAQRLASAAMGSPIRIIVTPQVDEQVLMRVLQEGPEQSAKA